METLTRPASDLGLHCLLITLLGVARLEWIKLIDHPSKNKFGLVRQNAVDKHLISDCKYTVDSCNLDFTYFE